MPKVRKALILTADKFEDMELFFPYFRLLEEKIEVDIAAPENGHIEGEHGYGLEIEKTFEEIQPQNYDILLIPGGAPMEHLQS
jgi:protease I